MRISESSVLAHASTTMRQSKADAPEFLLLMVVSFMLWSIGLVDLLAHTTSGADAQVLGLYSRRVFVILIAHSLLFFVWLAVLLIPRSHLWLTRWMNRAQDRPWLAVSIVAIASAAIWNLLSWPDWLNFPGFSTVLLIFLLLLSAIFVLRRWRVDGKVYFWRKTIVGLVLLWAALEATAQGLAYSGQLPGSQYWDGGYVGLGRVYQNREGFSNGQANPGGWYAEEFKLEPGSQRIALIGDTFIQALQVTPAEQLAPQLENLLNQVASESIQREVLPLGHPGYGPGVSLHPEMLDFMRLAYAPQEVIVFLHLGNDLRNLTTPSEIDPYYQVNHDGSVEPAPASLNHWHDVAHYVLVAYEPFHPIRVIRSHAMLPMLFNGLLGNSDQNTTAPHEDGKPLDIPGVRGVITSQGATVRGHTLVRSMALVDTPGWSNFLFEKAGNAKADEAHAITNYFISRANEFAQAHGFQLRLVTIPVFPSTFYEQQTGEWSPEIGEYDLFLPEKRLQEFAESQGIPMLAMGQQMLEKGLTTEEIQQLFFAEGEGHFTVKGHTYFAQAIFDCFYHTNDAQVATNNRVCQP